MEALVVAVASCGYEGTEVAPPGSAPGIINGSRLRARVYAMEGGADAFRGWYDTTIGTPCVFTLASDATLRCLPSNDVAQIEVVFSDQDCSQPMAANRTACAPMPPYVRGSAPSGRCDFAAIGAPYITRSRHVFADQMSVVYTKKGDGSCADHGARSPSEDYYDLDPMDPSGFVSATLGRMASTGSRLVGSTIRGDDGSQQPAGIYDSERQEPCVSLATLLGRGTDLCIPDMAWGTDRYFTDSKCTARVAYQSKLMQSCAKAVVGVDELGTPEATFFSPGDEVSIGTIYSTALGPRCAALRSNPEIFKQDKLDHAFYKLGAPIAASSFAPLVTRQVGHGRLTMPYHATPAGELLERSGLPWYLNDTALGAPCDLVKLGDGKLRCLADYVTFFDTVAVFSDGACTHAVMVLPGASVPRYVVRAAEACGPPWVASGVFAVGEEIAPPLFSQSGPEKACITRTAFPGEHVYEFGAPVDLGAFATVFETVE